MDGSAESLSAAEVVEDLVGDRIGRLTLASVVDYDTALGGTAGVAHRSVVEELARAAVYLGQRLGSEVDTVVLAGRPAEVLAVHATDGGFDVLAIGSRGRGASKLIMGSVASRLSRGAGVPVLIVTST
jgi:nucleotide-binding universal stress UspA family protein